ncbi:MAG: site-2 protease family protein [Candidatus Sungbacteria bacterium]|nr:site-2 protease family protein [Candidatus Sungbacteria bacterium]
MEKAIQIGFEVAILIFSVVIHEVSHGYAALWLGDKTAHYAGRLTLNPIKHLDPFGSVLLPVLLLLLTQGQGPVIGWAKPVPFNPYNLRNPFRGFGVRKNWGPAIVGAAGPCANLLLALGFGLLIRIAPGLAQDLSGSFLFNFMQIASAIVLLNLLLMIFNLMPVPPLDGSKVLFALLPYQWRNVELFLEQYGFILLLLLIFLFSHWLFYPVLLLFRLITGMLPIL